jgi:hypothetical protein
VNLLRYGGDQSPRLPHPEGYGRLVMRRLVGLGLAALIALVVAGFILGGYLDATGASSIPGMFEFMRLPKPARIVIELVIGVPIAFGVALYLILETAELLWFLGTPIRWLFAEVRRK